MGDFNCVLCGDGGVSSHVASKIKGDRHGILKAVKCPACGHVQLDPPAYDLGFYNQDGQIVNVLNNYGTPMEVIIRHSLVESERRVARFGGAGVSLEPSAPGGTVRVLDVGGGYGFFGAAILKQRPKVEVTVLEPSEQRAKFGLDHLAETGVKAPEMIVGLLDDAFAEANSGAFDVVTIWHVLEHLPQPLGLLRLAAKVTKPGGVVCVEVPNLNDELLDRSPAFHERHFMVEHISYFSPETLASAARRALPGAAIEVHGYQRYGIFNYMHWIAANAPQGVNPDMFGGEDRWWLETAWRSVKEQTRTSDALHMVVRI